MENPNVPLDLMFLSDAGALWLLWISICALRSTLWNLKQMRSSHLSHSRSSLLLSLPCFSPVKTSLDLLPNASPSQELIWSVLWFVFGSSGICHLKTGCDTADFCWEDKELEWDWHYSLHDMPVTLSLKCVKLKARFNPNRLSWSSLTIMAAPWRNYSKRQNYTVHWTIVYLFYINACGIVLVFTPFQSHYKLYLMNIQHRNFYIKAW